MRRQHDEGGFVTLWVLGICVTLLFLGGITLDLWRAVATHQGVASAVDAAAVAGASGIDEAAYRASDGEVVRLDPDRARTLAARSLSVQSDSASLVEVDVEATTKRVTVRAGRAVEFTFLRVLLPNEKPLTIRASAVVDPRRSS